MSSLVEGAAPSAPPLNRSIVPTTDAARRRRSGALQRFGVSAPALCCPTPFAPAMVRHGTARTAVADAHVRGPLQSPRRQQALPNESGQGTNRPERRVRSADADRIRLRRPDGEGRSRQGRRADLPHRRHGGALRRHSAGEDEHLDDDQRHRRLAVGAVRRGRRASGADAKQLRGTTQNDIIKEFLSRGTFIFPPEPSLRLTADTIEYTVRHIPSWNPMNLCSYHLQEAGATPAQEIAFTLANACTVLDRVKERPGVSIPRRRRRSSRSSSTPASASSRRCAS